MTLTPVTNGRNCCTYPNSGGLSCLLLVDSVNVLKWWCVLRLQCILISGALFVED